MIATVCKGTEGTIERFPSIGMDLEFGWLDRNRLGGKLERSISSGYGSGRFFRHSKRDKYSYPIATAFLSYAAEHSVNIQSRASDYERRVTSLGSIVDKIFSSPF